MSKLEARKLKIELEDTDVAALVRYFASNFAVLAADRNIKYTVDAHEACVAAVDPDKLQRVVMNLLGNAFKFTPAGGLIRCALQQSRDQLVVSVDDSGPGVKPERTRREEDPSPAAGQALRAAVPAADAVRILVVDDNVDAAAMLVEALTRRGYHARAAHDSPAALRVAAELSPHIAFLDIGLPVMDGYELAAHLRDIPGLAGIHLIAVTGYGQASDRRRTEAAGFSQHLVKPVDIDAIEATLIARGHGRR